MEVVITARPPLALHCSDSQHDTCLRALRSPGRAQVGMARTFKAVRLRGGEEDGLVYPLLKMCKTLNRSQARVARLGLNMIQTFQARGAGF